MTLERVLKASRRYLHSHLKYRDNSGGVVEFLPPCVARAFTCFPTSLNLVHIRFSQYTRARRATCARHVVCLRPSSTGVYSMFRTDGCSAVGICITDEEWDGEARRGWTVGELERNSVLLGSRSSLSENTFSIIPRPFHREQ